MRFRAIVFISIVLVSFGLTSFMGYQYLQVNGALSSFDMTVTEVFGESIGSDTSQIRVTIMYRNLGTIPISMSFYQFILYLNGANVYVNTYQEDRDFPPGSNFTTVIHTTITGPRNDVVLQANSTGQWNWDIVTLAGLSVLYFRAEDVGVAYSDSYEGIVT
ncbi:MAG: hypothetical protein ACFE7E_00025 [Candidatus Hodarchaeota archaeon]